MRVCGSEGRAGHLGAGRTEEAPGHRRSLHVRDHDIRIAEVLETEDHLVDFLILRVIDIEGQRRMGEPSNRSASTALEMRRRT